MTLKAGQGLPPRVVDRHAYRLAIETAAAAARERDPERQRDLQELAVCYWSDAFGRGGRHV